MLKSERVCGKHFVSGKPALSWDKHNVDWVPTLQLGKKNYRPQLDHEANAERAERAKKREKLAVERQEREVPEKRRKLLESSLPSTFQLLRSTLGSQVLRQKKREVETKGMRRRFLQI